MNKDMSEVMIAGEWNEKYPEGTDVIIDLDGYGELSTKTRSEAWTTENGQAVIMVNGRTRYYLLSRVRPAKVVEEPIPHQHVENWYCPECNRTTISPGNWNSKCPMCQVWLKPVAIYKKCPICGNSPDIAMEFGKILRIMCFDCGLELADGNSNGPEVVINRWNSLCYVSATKKEK